MASSSRRKHSRERTSATTEGSALIGDEIRQQWMGRAMRSECARNIDECLSEKPVEAVRELKQLMLEQIYDALGNEIIPEDLESALVVTNEKFHPLAACCLNILTCGLFHFFRPKDDDSVLVMMKKAGRVLVLRKERPDFFAGQLHRFLLSSASYILILLAVLSVPLLLLLLLGTRWGGDDAFALAVANVQVAISEQVLQNLKNHYLKWTVLYLGLVLALLLLLWANCPHDYGTQYRQSHAAKTVVAGQLSFAGRTARRRAVLRLYFGRYPPQHVLDGKMPLCRGQVAGIVPREELLKGGPGAGRDVAARMMSTAPTAIVVFTVILSAITVLDSSFTWVDRYWGVANLASVRKFCQSAPADLVTGPGNCTVPKCQDWAHQNKIDPKFCREVRWLAVNDSNILTERQAAAQCLQSNNGQPPCCAGCLEGGALTYLDNGLAAFKGFLSVLSDLGAIILSTMAARYAMGVIAEEDHVDVTFWGRLVFRHQTSNLELTQPLAVHFMERVFRKVWQEQLQEQKVDVPSPTACKPQGGAGPPADPRQKVSHASQGAGRAPGDHHAGSDVRHKASSGSHGSKPGRRQGSPVGDSQPRSHGDETAETGRPPVPPSVSNFEVDSSARDWDEFFTAGSLLLPGGTRWIPRVIVPIRCLGIFHYEEVLAAWAETPHVTLIHVLPNVAISVALFIVILLWPTSEATGSLLIPGIGNDFRGQFLSASILGCGFLFGSIAVMYVAFFRAVQHVVVLTDRRLFYVRHRKPCLGFCFQGRELRVDVFRHDHDVCQGHMNSTYLSLLESLARMQWVPGVVLMQVKHGVLQLTRRNGHVLDVFNSISQLTKKPDILDKASLEEAGVFWPWCQQWVENAMVRKGSSVWRLLAQPDDPLFQDPDIYLSNSSEQPLFAWSFKEVGRLASAYNTNMDVIVTSGRVLQWNRTIYKTFDCKTTCCWCLCWCSCCMGFWKARLPSSLSFLALSSLLAFTTETTVEPPLRYGPCGPPVKVHCFDELCRVLTRLVTCDPGGLRCDFGSCNACPRRAGPRAQLRMTWRLRQNVRQPQPDLQCCLRPYALPGCEDVELGASLGLRRDSSKISSGDAALHDTTRRMDMLRRIMGVTQDCAAKDI